jgi:hypothetical protein
VKIQVPQLKDLNLHGGAPKVYIRFLIE